MDRQDWLYIGLAFVVALAATPLVRAGARRVGMIARPRADRWHKKPTALLGGVGIFLGVLVSFLFGGIPWLGNAWLCLGALFVFAVGLIDDIWHIKPRQKLLGQIIAALAFLLAGTVLPWTPFSVVNYLLTFIWIIGITNAINLLDNMDGLAAGVSLIAAGCIAFILWQNDQTIWATLSASLAAALAGFLIYNHNPASIFMGDCGALFIGYVLSAVSLHATATLPTDCYFISFAVPVLSLAVPIFDTTFVTLLRKLAGRPASQGGRDHTSHRLVALGWTERQAVWVLCALALLAGAVAILLRNAPADVALPFVFLFVCVVIFLGIHLARVVTYFEEEFQFARQKKPWIACWWQAAQWRLLDRILDSCLILLVWQWDCRLAIDTSSISERVLLLGATTLLVKLACLSTLGVYRDSWASLRPAHFFRLASAMALAELVCFVIVSLATSSPWIALKLGLFDFCILLAMFAGLRAIFRAVGALLHLKQI
jgi:UDP-GlcNAc:undecaprenyl-phosphate/decaprenyl-phosphate GlcNAc-1-phosphate transferase